MDGHGLAAGKSVGGEAVRKEKEWRIGENRPQFKSRHEIKDYPNQKANLPQFKSRHEIKNYPNQKANLGRPYL